MITGRRDLDVIMVLELKAQVQLPAPID